MWSTALDVHDDQPTIPTIPADVTEEVEEEEGERVQRASRPTSKKAHPPTTTKANSSLPPAPAIAPASQAEVRPLMENVMWSTALDVHPVQEATPIIRSALSEEGIEHEQDGGENSKRPSRVPSKSLVTDGQSNDKPSSSPLCSSNVDPAADQHSSPTAAIPVDTSTALPIAVDDSQTTHEEEVALTTATVGTDIGNVVQPESGAVDKHAVAPKVENAYEEEAHFPGDASSPQHSAETVKKGTAPGDEPSDNGKIATHNTAPAPESAMEDGKVIEPVGPVRRVINRVVAAVKPGRKKMATAASSADVVQPPHGPASTAAAAEKDTNTAKIYRVTASQEGLAVRFENPGKHRTDAHQDHIHRQRPASKQSTKHTTPARPRPGARHYVHRHFHNLHPTANKLVGARWDAYDRNIHARKLATVKSTIDTGAPPTYSHLDFKRKKIQLALERQQQIEKDNEILVRNMKSIMKMEGKQFDQYPSPLRFAHSLHAEKRYRDAAQIEKENLATLKRLEARSSFYPHGEALADRVQNLHYLVNRAAYPRHFIAEEEKYERLVRIHTAAHDPMAGRARKEEVERDWTAGTVTPVPQYHSPRPPKTAGGSGMGSHGLEGEAFADEDFADWDASERVPSRPMSASSRHKDSFVLPQVVKADADPAVVKGDEYGVVLPPLPGLQRSVHDLSRDTSLVAI
ncbi:Ubiquitin-protein ligase [Thoreauomyces humboldtii]|nr:Ubiquitin-protein ligase [Thoreauomyces humboldtii]